MLTAEMRTMLVEDFMSWGAKCVGLALRLAQSHGVLCSGTKYSDGAKG